VETSLKNNLIACQGCGLIQDQPEALTDSSEESELACVRCGHAFLDPDQKRRSLAWTRSFSLGALILLPPALLMEMVQIEQLGHAHSSSVLGAIIDLLKNGQIPLGLLLLICSIIFPLAKLLGLLALTGGMIQRWEAHHKKRIWQWIEWTGRFGMLDVLLVTLFVAFVKLGDLVTINVGPGLYLFAASVFMNLLAAFCFDPHSIWSDEPELKS
jgi:paraquat-inducible protein A